MKTPVNWPKAIRPLLEKYRGTRHPLEFKNRYQLVVAVILSAQSTDSYVNQISPALFRAFPNMKALAAATPEEVVPHIRGVRGYLKKARWLVTMAGMVKSHHKIPVTMEGLTALPGIGRKSANVIMWATGIEPQGVVVDLHVLRVAPRLGIATGKDAGEIESQIMDVLPPDEWSAGMAMSFLGREICRPRPRCEICLMRPVCQYYQALQH